MKTITVTIDRKGKTRVEANGFVGESCLEATRALEEALGVETERDQKPEMLQQEDLAYQEVTQ